MVTYNCTACGSWNNQYLGRTTTKDDNVKFQLAPGPPTDTNCPHCGGRQMVSPPSVNLLTKKLGGPMWGGPLHNRDFVQKMQKTVEQMDESLYITRPRMLGMLSLAAEVTLPPAPSNMNRNSTSLFTALLKKSQVALKHKHHL